MINYKLQNYYLNNFEQVYNFSQSNNNSKSNFVNFYLDKFFFIHFYKLKIELTIKIPCLISTIIVKK